MKKLITGLFLAALLAGGTRAASTEITAERLDFNYEEHRAVFQDNVRVVDPEMEMTCSTLTVHFTPGGGVKTIEARGEVEIVQENRRAEAGRVTYDAESGEFVLRDDPKVMRDQDVLEGELIRFWRDENRMVCESGARLKLFLDRDDSGFDLDR